MITFETRAYRIVVDGGHLALISVMTGFCAWYLLDARAASTSIENLMLVEPVALFTFVAFLFIVKETVRIEKRQAEETKGPERTPLGSRDRVRIFGSMCLLAAYVASMSFIGYDVSTFFYIAASLALLGERRLSVLIGAPLVFCLVSIYLFDAVLETQIPLFFGPHP